MKHIQYILLLALLLLATLFAGCEKEINEVSTVSLGIPITFEHFSPGDSLLAGQILSIRGKGMRRLSEVSANGSALTYEEKDNGIDIKIDPFFFPDGSYTFKMKRFDGEQLISTPPVQVFSYSLSVNSGKTGDEIAVTAGGGLNNVQKILFTSAKQTVEAPMTSHTAQEIKFKVPVGAVKGTLYLQLNNPSDPANPIKLSAGQFDVQIPAPIIGNITPAIAGFGSIITITGQNFGDVGTNGELFYNRKVLFTGLNGSQIEGTLLNTQGSQTATQIMVVVPYFAQSGNVSIEIEYQSSNPLNLAINSTVNGKRLFYVVNGAQLNVATLQIGQPGAYTKLVDMVTAYAPKKDENRIYYSADGLTLNYLDLSTGQSNIAFSDANGFAEMEIHGNKIFWRDYTGMAIHAASLDGSNIETLYYAIVGISAFTVSADGKNLYVAYPTQDQNGVYFTDIDKVDVNTKNSSTVIKGRIIDFTGPMQIANNQLYYLKTSSTLSSIATINLSGNADPATVHSAVASHTIGGLGIDATTSRMYWFDIAGGTNATVLKSADLNGTGIQQSTAPPDFVSGRILAW